MGVKKKGRDTGVEEAKYMTRLVAKCYNQIPSIDFTKHSSVQTITWLSGNA